MASKLIESAQRRWLAVNGPHLVALVRTGGRFEKSIRVQRPDHESGVVGAKSRDGTHPQLCQARYRSIRSLFPGSEWTAAAADGDNRPADTFNPTPGLGSGCCATTPGGAWSVGYTARRTGRAFDVGIPPTTAT